VQVSFLLDENIAAPLANKLDKAGHEVERIVDVSELGEGIDDTTICQYPVREGRLIVTIPGSSMRYEGRQSSVPLSGATAWLPNYRTKLA